MRQILDVQLHDAIEKLNPRQKKALWGIVKVMTEEETEIYDPWQDASFVAEMEHEYNDYKKGKIKSIPFDEVRKNSKEAAQKLKSKKAG